MTDPTDGRFCLLDEPWILARTLDGRTETLSLREVFRRSDELAGVVGDLPTQAFASLRLLLAILRRATGGPATTADWQALAAAGGPPMVLIEPYLTAWRDRFYLFHPQTPFYQTPGLHTAKNDYSGLEKLIADVPAGNPFQTTRLGAALERISAAEAARWVVHAQAFDCSGIKSGAVGDPRVKGGKGYPQGTGWVGVLGGVYVEGATLWRTLLLNLVPLSKSDLVETTAQDRPAWEAAPTGPAVAADAVHRPYGPLDLLTWQSRRIRLRGDADGVTGVVLAYGEKLAPPYWWAREPMTGWRRSEPQEKKLKLPLVYMPAEHRPERVYWRGLEAMLPAAAPRASAAAGNKYVAPAVFEWAADCPDPRAFARRAGGRALVNLRAVGMRYGSQSSTFADIFDDGLDVSPELLRTSGSLLPDLATAAVRAAEAGVVALRNLASNVVKAAGGTDAKLVEGAQGAASTRAYATLDSPFRAWLAGLDARTEVETARFEWHRTARAVIRRIGADVVADGGPAAWVGREVGGRRLSAPEADRWFQAAVATALPVPKAEPAAPPRAPDGQGPADEAQDQEMSA